MTSPDGLLTTEELDKVIRIKAFIGRIQDAIFKANQEALNSGLRRIDGEPLRLIQDWPCALLGNDLVELLTIHDMAEKRIATAAREAVAA